MLIYLVVPQKNRKFAHCINVNSIKKDYYGKV